MKPIRQNKIKYLFPLIFISLTFTRTYSQDASESNSNKHPQTELAANAGYGFNNLYRFGLGLRLGTTLASHWYIGAAFDYHFGRFSTITFASTNYSSIHPLLFGVEAGYQIALHDDAALRPYIGIGLQNVEKPDVILFGFPGQNDTSTDESDKEMYASPGILLNIHSFGKATLGFDGSLRYLLSSDEFTLVTAVRISFGF